MLISLPPICSYILLFFAITVSCLSDTATARYSQNTSLSKLISELSSAAQKTFLFFSRLAFQSTSGIGIWEIMRIAGICASIPAILYIRKKSRQDIDSSESAQWRSSSSKLPGETVSPTEGRKESTDALATDPGLLKKHSEFRSFTTSRFTYESLRIFFRPHPQLDKFPTKPAPLPLLVFIHGLGGSAAQFGSLLTSLVNASSCLAIDLPGCGLSKFSPKSWQAYETEALAELLAVVIEDYRDKESGQGVVLIGHSYGCSLSALLASKTSTLKNKLPNVVGLVAICPRADPPTEKQVAAFRKLLCIPGPIFDLWRRWDRRGGPDSASVKRFVGENADDTSKMLQERFNCQSKTPVWRRMASGSLPVYKDGIPQGGIPGKDVWAGLEVPVFLIAGEADNITKPEEIQKIAHFLGKSHPLQIEMDQNSEPIIDSAAPVNISEQSQVPREDESSGDQESGSDNALSADSETTLQDDPSTPTEGSMSAIPFQPIKPKKVLKTTVLPAPAGHALLYTPATVRILSGLISDFLCTQVSPRLSLGWQLQHLSTTAKWDVKNLNKWKGVAPVSEPIAGIFRALKTLREVDETHCPEVFVKQWGSQIKDIIDISHEQPVYDPRGLEKGGVRYHKFPTVSKIPPTSDEVKDFIALVDRVRAEQKVRAQEEKWEGEYFVGVHCHYGFNRTGYFIVCYLVERCGFSVQGAVDEFAKRRPKGIKHAHFLDQLFLRYCVGLKRAPTL